MLDSLHSKKKQLSKQQMSLKKSQDKWRREKLFLSQNPTRSDYERRREALKYSKQKLDDAVIFFGGINLE